MFQVVKQSRIYKDVVDQIQEAILKGDLQPGDTLPSERKLREQFKISRGTLREALRVLEHKGLVEIHVGVAGGAVVRSPKFGPIQESLDFLIRFRKISLDHLEEFREDIEGAVAALAARRAPESDVRHLDELIRQAAELVEEGVKRSKDFVILDKKIHQTIAHAADNPLYFVIQKMIHENIEHYYEEFLPWTQEMMEENLRHHRELADMIRRHDENGARRMAQQHIRKFNDYMMRNKEARLK